MEFVSGYPVVEGYKDFIGVGYRMNFSSPIGLHNFDLTAAVTPFKDTLGNFIDIIRSKNKDVPILVISKIRYAREINSPKTMEGLVNRAAWQKQLVADKKKAGDKNVYFLDGGTLLGEHAEECTVDGVHPTDLGFMRMAKGIEPVLREILQ